MKPIRSLGIIAFKDSEMIRDLATKVISWSRKNGLSVMIHPVVHDLLKLHDTPRLTENAFTEKSEAFLSLGGDGTFLSAVHLSGFSSKPILGVNLGGLGFLTDLAPEETIDGLSRICNGDYQVVQRMVLEAEIHREGRQVRFLRGLNDIFINRHDRPKLVSIAAWHGDDYITDFQADGIILATPGGSTAYSLAAGGPIVEPDVDAFILTPICPHSLTERPMILPSDRAIRLLVRCGGPTVMLSADGLESETLCGGDEIIIRKARECTNLMRLSDRTYFELLRTKLDWSRGLKKENSR